MQLSSILKIFKKGSKAAGKHKGKKGPAPGKSWPSGIRIGVFGHANSGKTIYFTVLNEECKISKNLQISVTDNATAGEFLNNYRSIWGLGTSSDAGTVVDLRGEKKFPDPTTRDRLLFFKAIIDLNKSVSVVTYDYEGKAVSINETGELPERVLDFMAGCHGILFFYDPKLMKAELESQAHVASFVNMLESLSSLQSRLPIPVALVITKSDILPGFSGEQQVTLISPEDEYLVSENFELFLERVLSSGRIASNSAWAGSVRNVLVRLKDFLRVVLTRTLDFQVFFISATGETPEKIGSEVGRSVYAPPAKMKPIGVKEPFYWLLNSILRNRRISKFRTLAKYVTLLSIIWIVMYSLPFIYHFSFLYDRPVTTEKEILEPYNGRIFNTTDKERNRIIDSYNDYQRSKLVRWLFTDFRTPAQRIAEGYGRYNQQEAIKQLNSYISEFTLTVKNKNLWPKLNPVDSIAILTQKHEELRDAIKSFHTGNEQSILYTRSARVLESWDLFIKVIEKPNDTTLWQTIEDKLNLDRERFGNDFNSEEVKLAEALLDQKVKEVKQVVSKKVAVGLGDKIDEVNNNLSPAYRLDKAVKELQDIRMNLDPRENKQDYQMVSNYINVAEKWNNKRTFRYKVESVPDDGHMHIEVTARGAKPTWPEGNDQIFPGSEYSLQWKVGDVIHIVFHKPHIGGNEESWGVRADDMKILDSKYSLFEMENGIMFESLGKKAVVKFLPGSLIEQLPKLEK
ncbi:MAG: hypothetical protein PHU88_01970 [candidate division Zixibacteria bacterium]|nr:hypothetical protein [candidate division Zixibacteria bacterium]MDD5425317.1 hypothetical protein [candidate division Zixibacteria bacterium]